ncbi:MAG: ComEC family competence protein [Bacteroidales bacterium]|nr:ComEC family competence protein [Bacteroidales bacterium]
MRRVPLLMALLPFVAGIVATELLPTLHLGYIFWAMTALVVLLAIALLWRGNTKASGIKKSGMGTLPVVLLMLLFVTFGGLRARMADPMLHPDHYAYHLQPGATLSMRLCSTPLKRARSYSVVAVVEAVQHGSQRHASRGKIQLFVAADSLAATLHYGDRLVAHANPVVPSSCVGDDGFNYRKYLHRKGIERQCYLPAGSYRVTATGSKGLRSVAEKCRTDLRDRLQRRALTPSQTAVAEALLLGWRDDLSDETTTLYRNAGVAHLLCVSGLHVGIVAAVLMALFWPVGRRRWQRALRGAATMTGVWLFALLSGLAPATVRAAVMFSIFIVTDVFVVRTSRYNTIALAALVMLVSNPMLLFDVGFELSYAAVLGIAAGSCAARRLRLRGDSWFARVFSRAIDLLVLTTSAQLATLPFTLYYFHSFPTWFVVANMTIVPCAGLLMASALAVLVIGSWPIVGPVAEWLLSTLLSAVDWLLRAVAMLPYATLQVPNFTLPAALLAGGAVVALFVGVNAISAGCQGCRE